MAGTKAGAVKALVTRKKRYGDGYFAKIGRIGGQKGWPEGVVKGFARRLQAKEILREDEKRALKQPIGDPIRRR